MLKLLKNKPFIIALRGLSVFTCVSILVLLSSLALAGPSAISHAPISIMGDHLHQEGEWMVSYRAMNMQMSGNLKGDETISDTDIVTGEPNRFAGMPMMPPTLRVVPQTMTTTMHMFGAMYAPTDDLTLMLMLNYIEKDMNLKTFQGGMGTNVLGSFNSQPSGLGDTKVAALYRLYDNEMHHVHANFSISIPTGSIDEEGRPLTPTNMRPLRRLPYPMQLGSGTYDFTPGVTYTGRAENWAWGTQLLATVRTGTNDEGYTFGDETKLNAWVQYGFTRAVSGSFCLEYKTSERIDGIDDQIALPVQTADPVNSGRDLVNVKLGVNTAIQSGALEGHRFAVEYVVPVLQDVNGVQMDMDAMWTFGYQIAF